MKKSIVGAITAAVVADMVLVGFAHMTKLVTTGFATKAYSQDHPGQGPTQRS